MGYLVKAVVGGALFLGGIVLFNVKLVALLETGTCASGNVPYEIAEGYECPSETGSDVMLMVAAIFGGLIGAAIFAFRGAPPWGSGRHRSFGMFGFGTFAWGLFFASTGAASLVASLTNESIQDSNGGELGGIIVGSTFLLMGLPALLISLFGFAKGIFGGDRDERPSSPPTGSAMDRMRAGLAQASGAQQVGESMGWSSVGAGGRQVSAGDTIGKIERLQRLKESGALSQDEFEREKARVLAEQ